MSTVLMSITLPAPGRSRDIGHHTGTTLGLTGKRGQCEEEAAEHSRPAQLPSRTGTHGLVAFDICCKIF